ncbi:MAG: hypothetical protein L6R35_002853, partial [Caloplaca aegaea]
VPEKNAHHLQDPHRIPRLQLLPVQQILLGMAAAKIQPRGPKLSLFLENRGALLARLPRMDAMPEPAASIMMGVGGEAAKRNST